MLRSARIRVNCDKPRPAKGFQVDRAVSCVCCTTAARRWCLPLAIRAWRAQTLATKELIIVFSGPGTVKDLVPEHKGIRLVEVEPTSLGDKHNLGVERARYPWIAKWDDDDWHASWRLARSLDVAETRNADIVSCTPLIVHELTDDRRSYEYHYQLPRPWLPAQAAVWKRDLWRRTPYPERDSGIDTLWIWDVLERGAHAATFADPSYVLYEWGQKTGRKAWNPRPPEYLRIPRARITHLVGDDLEARMEAFRKQQR